jgi:recombinational DNA repair protein (RecF pathway)
MHRDRTTCDPARLELKRCAACTEVKRAKDFYVSRGRLSSYCKDCQRQASRRAYRRRRQDPATRAQMRSVDRLRKRQERARLAQLDPDRVRRAERARRAALRRLIAAYEPEYRFLLSQERAALEGSGRGA